MRWTKNWNRADCHSAVYADDCNIYVGQPRGRRTGVRVHNGFGLKSAEGARHRDKSDTGRPWERQFLGFQPTEDGALRPAPKSMKKLKDRVHEFFSGRRSGTSEHLRDEWLRFYSWLV